MCPTDPEDDHLERLTRIKRGQPKAAQRLAAREVCRRVQWLSKPLVFWTGTIPGVTFQRSVAYRPILHLIAERLSGLSPGLYVVESKYPSVDVRAGFGKVCRCINPTIASVQPVHSRRIAQTARALEASVLYPDALRAILDDVEAWQSRSEAALHTVSAALTATTQLDRPKPSASGLAIEECSWWIGPDAVRPSHRVPQDNLLDWLQAGPDVAATGRKVAALLLGQRHVSAARLPAKYLGWHRLGWSLSRWPVDLLAHLQDPKQQLSRLAGGTPGSAWVNSPEAASAIVEFLWADPQADSREWIGSLPAFRASCQNLLEAPRVRHRQLIQLVEGAIKTCPPFSPARAGRWYGPVSAFNQALAHGLAGLTGSETVREKRKGKAGWQTIHEAFMVLLGIPFPPSPEKFRSLVADDPREAQELLLDEVNRVLLETLPNPANPWPTTLSGLAGRICGWAQQDILTDLAQWLQRCCELTPPGRTGDQSINLAQRALEYWMAVTGRSPENIVNLIRILAERVGTAPVGHSTQPAFDWGKDLTRARLRENLWVLGQLGELNQAQLDYFVRHKPLQATARILQTNPERLPRIMSHLANPENHGDGLWPCYLWTELFLDCDERLVDPCLSWYKRIHALPQFEPPGAFRMLEVVLDTFENKECVSLIRKIPDVLNRITDAAAMAIARVPEGEKYQEWRSLRNAFERRSDILDVVAAWTSAGCPNPDQLLDTLLKHCAKRDASGLRTLPSPPWNYFTSQQPLQPKVQLAQGQPLRLLALLECRVPNWFRWDEAHSGWRFLEHHPAVRLFLGECMDSKDLMRRALDLLCRLGLAIRLHSRDVLNRDLQKWTSPPLPPPAGPALPIGLAGHLIEPLTELAAHRAMAKEKNPWPPEVQKILDRPDSLRRECDALEKRVTMGSATHPMRLRLEKLKDYTRNTGRLQRWMDRDLLPALRKHSRLAKLQSLERVAGDAIRLHWEKVLGGAPGNLDEPDWDNALRLYIVTEENKALLRKLLRQEAKGDHDWVRAHPMNRKCAESLVSQGINMERWMNPFEHLLQVHGETWTAYAETEILRVLQMGNVFDTCLSVGAMNDFATIANAVEINKRVLYLKNEKGAVIGRKLIGLAPGGVLIGFNSYGAGDSDDPASGAAKGRPWIKILFDLLCLEIVRAIGAKFEPDQKHESVLAEKLELFAKWYNDGPEPFDWWIVHLADTAGARQRPLPDAVRDQLRGIGQAPRMATLRGLLWLGERSLPILEQLGPQCLDQLDIRFLHTHSQVPSVKTLLCNRDWQCRGPCEKVAARRSGARSLTRAVAERSV